MNAINRYKYYKKIQKSHFLFNINTVNVYPISEYREALQSYSSLGAVLLHFACPLQNNSKAINKDIFSQYISDKLQERINSLPLFPFEGADYPLKLFEDGIYKGELNNDDKPNGNGVLLNNAHQNGSFYIGEFIDGEKNGRGRLVTDEFWYEGSWEKNKYHGCGKLIAFNGYIVEGEFKHGMLNGEGVERLITGESYQGSFANGLRNGHGLVRFADIIYEGEFINGEAEGPGIVKFGNGTSFKGVYSKGVGIGEFTRNDGTVLYGTMTGSVFTEKIEEKIKQ